MANMQQVRDAQQLAAGNARTMVEQFPVGRKVERRGIPMEVVGHSRCDHGDDWNSVFCEYVIDGVILGCVEILYGQLSELSG